ncbi:MAG: NAD+ synthase [Phycisphaerae bacterium]|nr:NAD+ synthase [Phycisphaerae bacterium]
MKIALAQMNSIIGDFENNSAKILEYIARAREQNAELVIFPELSLVGYPPKDLLLKPNFIEQNLDALDLIARTMPGGITAMVGCVQQNTSPVGRSLFNSMAVLGDGHIQSVHNKSLLPNYDVFDEKRYFEPGPMVSLARVAGKKIGLSICEDLWTIQGVLGRVLYHQDPLAQLAQAGAEIFINAAASPFAIGKNHIRSRLLSEHAQNYQRPLIYVNMVGGNDELVFDGASCVYGPDGNLKARCKSFEEDLLIVDLNGDCSGPINPMPKGIDSVYKGLVLGLRDYVQKCGFRKGVVIGLSGGIDSAVVAALAVDALGADMVHGVAMPSKFNAASSLTDSEILARNFGIEFSVIPIEQLRTTFLDVLAPSFTGLKEDVTEENIQARIRGTLLMALSNKFGYLLLSTGNKSEMSMGYCTLYGDMAGGLGLISDVPKTMVYELARYINRDREIIPANIITKLPSAELRFNQTDQDSLPPYELLDEILKLYIEEEQCAEQIITRGFDPEIVKKIIVTVDRNEYKRKQAAIGIKVTSRAFGSGRRVPIAQGFKQSFTTTIKNTRCKG